ncbi:uncharacterized protein BX664DRAFT_109594 [Halteromyces radiatus]|uniref:uncharacterized protein n=1 Tax=Halteromyces radiatus TaxID=101107 RepID=UPI002220A024|nr:uncharacterized protein BX664DRAFT_109594 [Halteromyces radiatus]KAI8093539.1 hypothetical protein BX664DRAFT_109594 [Halteromyces radiatus]
MPVFPHPLYQCLYHEPYIVLPEEATAIILLLPPIDSLPDKEQLDNDFLASHILPIIPADIHWPKPRSSLSASSVLSRITSPRIEPSHRFQKALPSKPRSQSLIGQQHPTDILPAQQQTVTNDTIKKKKFTTLNDKILYTGNNKVTTDIGFPTTVRATMIKTHQTTIQLGNIRTYSSPIIQHQRINNHPSSTTKTEAAIVPLLLIYLDRPILVKHASNFIPNKKQTIFQELLDGVDDQVFPTLAKMVQDASDEAIHTDQLDTLHATIETLVQNGLKVLHNMTIPSTIMQGQIHAAFESYIMEQTYDVVFFKITQVVLSRDLHLSEVIEQVKHVDVTQLGLPSNALGDARLRVQRAVVIFQNIGTYRTPFEKLDCILSTIRALSSSTASAIETTTTSDSLDTSDTLVPLLLLTVIQSRVPHLNAHWTYMKEYTFERDVIGGKYGFSLSTLEGVLVYISESAISQLATVSYHNQQLWRCLKNTTLLSAGQDRQHLEMLYARCHTSNNNYTQGKVIRDSQGNTPLLLACRSGLLDYVPFLASFESVTDTINDNGETTLMMAVISGSMALVEYLLTQYEWTTDKLNARIENSGNVHSSSSSSVTGRTALHLAACQQNGSASKILDLLVQAGVNCDIVDEQQNGPLHLACMTHPSHLTTTTTPLIYLLHHLPSSARRQPNRMGQTFFHLCQDQDLLEEYQNELVDTLDSRGRSPWLTWAAMGRFKIMFSLMDHYEVDQFRLDYQGRSGLHYMAEQLHLYEQQQQRDDEQFMTIEHAVYSLRDLVHVRDRLAGNTALHLVSLATKNTTQRTSRKTYQVFITSLLECGADIHAINDAGARPIDLCDKAYLYIFESWCLKIKPKALSDETNKMHQPWAVTRVLMDPVRYIIKSGKWVEPTETMIMTTVERTWDDFVFLRQELLHEIPESFLPTLNEGMLIDPCVFDLAPPPLTLLQKSVRQLDQFMDTLQRHPTLRQHDQVRGFVRTSYLNKAAIQDRSYSKRNLMIEKLGASLPSNSPVEDFDEVYFLTYSQGMIRPLRDALSNMVQQSQHLLQCQQGFQDTLDQVTQAYEKLTWIGNHHQEAIKICTNLASNTTYVFPFTSLVDSLETMNDTSHGVLIALEYPFTLLKRKAELVQQLEKQRDSLQKGKHPPWNGLFSSMEQTKQVEREKENIAKTLSTLSTSTNQINQSHQMVSDELAHYQRVHPDDMLKSIRSFARQQLKMEKLKLRWLTQTWLNVNTECTTNR